MDKNVIILDDKFLLGLKKYNEKNKKKHITFSFISFLFIAILLIFNLYFLLKLVNYKKNQLIQLLENEIKLSKNNYQYNIKEGKEQNNLNIKTNNSNDTNEYINLNNIYLERTDLNVLRLVENKTKFYIELTQEEQKFFYGLIRTIKPRKSVEIGVYKGGSSALILNGIKDLKGAKLFSIDKSNYCYRERSKKTGYIVKEKFPELMDFIYRWNNF
jgi:hypothetical protein